MTSAFGKQKVGDVFKRNCLVIKNYFIHFLHFVTGLSLIAWKGIGKIIVQITKKAVKTMIKKSIFSVKIVKPAYQKVNSFDINEMACSNAFASDSCLRHLSKIAFGNNFS